MSFEIELKDRISRTEEIISSYLPEPEDFGSKVMEAMDYSFLAGGKRIRPMLMMETHILCGGDGRLIAPFMAALEMIHTYSLVHDDLPAMDGDELRRGKPTTWMQFDEATAILAGDGLLNYSCEVACLAFNLAESPDDFAAIASALKIMYHHSGIYGMIGGQCVDIEAEGKEEISDGLIDSIYHNKTGALIASAMSMGTALAMAHAEDIDRAAECGYALGRAFQIRDDILDVTGSEEVLGKPIGSDERNLKPTYVAMHGIEKAQEEVRFQTEYAKSLVDKMPGDTEQLRALMDYLTGREM